MGEQVKTMVGTSVIAATTFPRFMSLATELWSQMWRDTLPDTIEPALYQFKIGCWHPIFLSNPTASIVRRMKWRICFHNFLKKC
ncbi:predicted protein [Botrytis cinerea T4]|uniref:Uncharacterized protein n=1 Tax=Botryotinia fuckeliana (strain T4) TaxID=999810 RepID=G2XTY2_BOTF4|nr:predicted protein [Botrytis cinerea T4]